MSAHTPGPTAAQLQRAADNLRRHIAKAAKRRERLMVLRACLPFFGGMVCAYLLGLLTMWFCMTGGAR